MSERKDLNKNVDGISKDRKEWSKEWGLEKQTQGLDKHAVAKQHKIAEELKKESAQEPNKTAE